MSLKLVTLNIEGSKHFDRVFPFLQSQMADVICLQEVFQIDLDSITAKLGGQILFVPMTNMSRLRTRVDSPRGIWGIAIWLSERVKLIESQTYYYRGSPTAALTDNDPGYDSSRAVVLVRVSADGEEFVIATTHFTWTPDGVADDRQKADFATLMQALSTHPELILCGDFNAPRGGEIFSAFCQHFTDNLPADVRTTLDPELHRYHNQFELAVDTIFSTPSYLVKDVIVQSGVSDHKAIVAQIERRAEG